jgi:putative salt-induced outer membrane protein YdiY
MDRKKLLTLALTSCLVWPAVAQAEDEPEGWTGDASLSFSSQTGTTDSIAGTLDLKTSRAWTKDVIGARFLGSYGTSREKGSDANDTTLDSQAVFGNWKHTVTGKFFWDSNTEASRDGTQDRDIRFTLSTGPGLRMWHGEDAGSDHFDVSVGVGYRYEVYDGNANDVGTDKLEDNLADGVIAFEYKNTLFDKVEYTHTGSARMPFNEINAYILRSEITLGVPLSAAWDLRAGFVAEYVKVTVDPNNELTTRTKIGLGYKF